MKLCSWILVTLLLSAPAIAGDNRSCSQPLGTFQWLDQGIKPASHDIFADIALVVTSNFDNARRDQIMDAVRIVGGRINLVFPPNVMVGRIPSPLHPLLIGQHGIQAIYDSPVDLMGINLSHENAFAGARFFNWVASGAMQQEHDRVRDIVVPIESLGEAITYAAAAGQSKMIAASGSSRLNTWDIPMMRWSG